MIKLSEKELINLISKDYRIDYENEDKFQSDSFDFILKVAPELKCLIFHPTNETGGYNIEITSELLSKFPKINSKKTGKLETDNEYKARLSSIRGAREKHKGKVAGVPDWIIKYKGILFSIELKLDKKVSKLNEDQEIIHEIWNRDFPEIPVFICRSLYEIYLVLDWIINKCKFKIVRI